MQPFFSVVIPLYNKEKYIKETLNSVLAQTFIDFEVIIINDGSTDNSLQVVELFKDERIKTYSQNNKGASAARNSGIDKSNTEYIAFLDADDLWLDNHLKILYNLIKEFPEASMFSSGYLISYNSHSKRAKMKNIPEGFKGIVSDFFDSNLYDSVVNSSIAVVKKAVLKSINGFDLDIKSGQDTDLWIRIALNHKVAINNVVTGEYVKNDESLSNSRLAIEKIKYLNKFIEEEKNNPSLKAYLDMNRYSVVILCKILKKQDETRNIYASINPKNLSLKQRLIYKLPHYGIKFLLKIKRNLDKKGLFFHLYR